MKKQYFFPEQDGFYGVYYPNPAPSDKAFIVMLGDSSDDRMVVSGVKWLQKRGCHVMAMSPDKKDYGHHDYPLERFGKAIEVLKVRGNDKIGIVGASTTGMMAQRSGRPMVPACHGRGNRFLICPMPTVILNTGSRLQRIPKPAAI